MRKIAREPKGAGCFSPGEDLVIAGAVGKAGVLEALSAKHDVLENRFTADFLSLAGKKAMEHLNLTPEFLLACGATEWEEAAEGGVFAALWNISGAYGRGFSVSLLDIPVEQEFIEVCELFDLNPYRLMSGECLILAADNGGDLVRALKERGIRSAVVGKVEAGIARKIIGPGGTGYLGRPQPDETYKLRQQEA